MQRQWAAAGQPADLFWRITPREMARVLAGAADALLLRRREAAWAAWTNAALMARGYHDPKKFPKLSEVMPEGPKAQKPRQGWREQQALTLAMNAMYGGEMKKRAN